ncbi:MULTISPECIES: hypothetical protein [Methylobacillus]|uniref:Uncharacterized protein n=1 Tax=Methylobacillus flagellatus (strain ATCC 51484 / DSM 6875 / VKM B-1610 / KT) TaxID=265072 RepID=Q1H4Z2_METFK|nr:MULTISPECIES: hypothetical protein [Methylobacillus]ABE48445.1 hypothetical protein Mfla_0174 [Methylobacillus flagellatus KT]MPS48240.1 hypothetical protein [Methylobacillus sp.]
MNIASHYEEVVPAALFRRPQSLFIYVKIPIRSRARPDPFHQREHELARLLQEADAGTVIGWGQSFSDAGQDGYQRVVYQRVDITTSDIGKARPVLRTMLETLAVPAGTEVHYTHQGQALMDIYTHGGWRLDQPYT